MREEIAARGVDISEVYHCASRLACRYEYPGGIAGRVGGVEPEHRSYSSFASWRWTHAASAAASTYMATVRGIVVGNA